MVDFGECKDFDNLGLLKEEEIVSGPGEEVKLFGIICVHEGQVDVVFEIFSKESKFLDNMKPKLFHVSREGFLAKWNNLDF